MASPYIGRRIDLTIVLSEQIWSDLLFNTNKAKSKGFFSTNSVLQESLLATEKRRPVKNIDITTKELTELVNYLDINEYIDQSVYNRLAELWGLNNGKGIHYKGNDLLATYFKGFDELGDFHHEVEIILDDYPNTHFEPGQEEYLGYIPSRDLFVSEWDGGWNYEESDDEEDEILMDYGSAMFLTYFELDEDGEVIVTDKQIHKGAFYGTSESERGERYDVSGYDWLHKQIPDLIDLRLD